MRLEDPGLIMPRVLRLCFPHAADPRITNTIQAIYFRFPPLPTGYGLLAVFQKKRAARESPGSSGSHRAAQPHVHFFSLKSV
jgi:hypothetical protein